MPVLFERDRDLGLLIDRVTGLADHAEGGVVIIEAPPGVGKTQLLAAAIELAQARSVRVLTAHGVELEHELAFGGVRQLFAPTLARLDPVAVRDVLRGPAAGAGPILGISDVPVPAGAEPLFALTAMVSNLAARGPVAIAVDDLQWLDEASARFLAYLARRLDGLPVLIVSATRPLDPPLPELATAWPPGTVFIRPEPLSANGVGRLLETVLGTPIGDDVVTACGRVTGGNPFLVTEIGRELAALPATGRAERVEEIAPAAVGAAVLLRIRRLPEPAGRLATAVALFPNGSTLADAAAVAGVPEPEAARAADDLVAAHVLAPSPALRFEHPVMRTAVYRQIGRFGRRAGHARAADVLAERGADAEEIAAHILAGEPSASASRVTVLEAAASRAERSGAIAGAVRYLARALDEPPPADRRPGLTHRLGRLQARAGAPEAVATLRRALELAAGLDRVDVAIDLATALFSGGESDAAVTTLLEVRSDARGDREHHLTVDALISHVAWASNDHAALYADVADALPRDLEGITPGERLALGQVGARMFDRCEPHAETADVLRRSFGPRGSPLVWQVELGDTVTLLIHAGALEEAERVCRRRQEEARATGQDSLYTRSLVGLTLSDWTRGDLTSCEANVRLAMELDGGRPGDLGLFAGLLAQVCTAKGEHQEARSLLDLAVSTGGLSMSIAWRRGVFATALGRPADAVRWFAEALRQHQQRRTLNPAETLWVTDYAEALTIVGRREEGLATLSEFMARAEAFGEPQALGVGHIALGRLTGGDRGLEPLERAVAILEPSPYRLAAARARLELGAALRRANRRMESREHLRLALDYADRHRLEPMAARAQEELIAGGGRPRRRAVVGVDALTPSERRIARLAADGMTNRDIAGHLFVTVKTVEMHLGRSFEKLGIGSRRELATLLAPAPASAGLAFAPPPPAPPPS